MRKSSLAISGPLTLHIDDLAGDLQIAGWERAEVSAKTDGDDLDVHTEGDKVFARCDSDLILYLPREANLQAGNIGGDVDIRAVTGNVTLENIGGDAQMRAIGPAVLGNVGGDLSLRGCSGNFTAENIGSDASLRDVQGTLKLGMIGSDLYLRNLSGDIQAQTQADAVLYLQPAPNAKVDVTAGADILLRLPPTVDAELFLQGGSMESIRVDFAEVEAGEPGMTRQVKLGSGAAKIRLTAGADLIVTSQAEEWRTLADFDTSNLDDMPPGDFPGIPADFHEKVARRVQEAGRRAQQAQRSADRTQRQMDAAMRRAEEKMRAAERRSNFMGLVVGRRGVGRPLVIPLASAVPPTPTDDPVSDEERLAVLKMLQEKKISIQDAEKLLAALEGR